ncbi:hypothetical protein OH77DRAFT_1454873 [Trametes cingulata]|nr:hypothetical protein OH77DRAFT_1454873 [Trametes cingulata]
MECRYKEHGCMSPDSSFSDRCCEGKGHKGHCKIPPLMHRVACSSFPYKDAAGAKAGSRGSSPQASLSSSIAVYSLESPHHPRTQATMPTSTKDGINQGYHFRLLSAPTVYDDAPLALGRDHASWFLVFAEAQGPTLKRATMCVNFVVPGDPRTVSATPNATSADAAGNSERPRFTIGGSQGLEALDVLGALRDQVGRAPVKVVRRYEDGHPMSLQAVVEVNIPEEELVRSCARCGKWEVLDRPRFQRCGRCKARYYCSQECQKEDWQPGYHKGECALLKEGKAYEAEYRRKLHDNGWWFNHGSLSRVYLLNEDVRSRAIKEGDNDLLTYGRRIPPRDVALLAAPQGSADASLGDMATGDKLVDEYLLKLRQLQLKVEAEIAREEAKNAGGRRGSLTIEDIPDLPPLPYKLAFVPTGDPLVDEGLLWKHVRCHGSRADLKELEQVISRRAEVMFTRREIAYELAEMLQENLGAETADDENSDAESEGSVESCPTVADSSEDEFHSESEAGTAESEEV